MIYLLGQAWVWLFNYSSDQNTILEEIERRQSKAPKSEHKAIQEYAWAHRDETLKAAYASEAEERDAEYRQLSRWHRIRRQVRTFLALLLFVGGPLYGIYWFIQTLVYDYHHL